MKSLKKTLVLLVVFSMILSAVMPAFAATDVYGLDCEEEVTRLEALGVVSGYDDGTYGPENTITRAEMAVILCKMVGIDEVTAEENKVVPSKFSDVKVGEWYTGFVNVAAGKGLLSGFPDGTFRPSEQLTMNQVLTLCVNALGRGEYVAEMGAWPANYIAEATKLGLLDGVKTSDANRGNIAIIAWNTLEAPYVWDVTNTEYEGTINLGNSTRSLLSIYFRDFVAEEVKAGEVVATYLKEADYVEVTAVPSTNGELGDNQIVLVATTDTDADSYEALLDDVKENKKPRGTDSDEWTTADGEEIIAYAPAFDNLDSYFGKVVTVIFGKDNEVVSIRVIDETVDNEYLTAYEDEKLEIAGNSYKFADDARVYINTDEKTGEEVECDCTPVDGEHEDDCSYEAAVDADAAMEVIEGILGIKFDEKYNKVIKANVVLNSKGKVTRLDLLVSGDYATIGTYEVVVEKVRNEVITLDNNEEIDYSEDGEYEDEDDRPRVIKDGTVIGLEDIEVGDVLTYFVNAKGTITTVYVSSNKVNGELTRASKTDFKLTVDGNAYYSSMEELYVTDDKISDAKLEDEVDSYIGEEVELYLNVYGEYVLMASEEADAEWVFGIVTRMDDEADEDEEDDNIFYKDIRVLLADGTTARNYKFVFDDEEEYDNEDADTLTEFEDLDLENKFIVFDPDANGEITVDDYQVITLDDNNGTIADGDYELIYADTDADVDDDRERIEGKIFGSDTVIFNLGDGDDPETSKSWKMLVEDEALAQEALLIFEEDSKTLSYVLINVSEDYYATSDAEYAIVVTDDYKEKRGSSTKKYAELLTLDGTEEFEAKNLNTDYTKDLEDMFIEYSLSGSKLNSADLLIDLPAFKKLKASEEVTLGDVENDVAGELYDGSETKLVVTLFAAGTEVEAEKHGTVACPNATDTTVETCDECTLVTKHQDEVLAVHADGCSKASETTVTECSECTLVTKYQAEVEAEHGKVACTCDDGSCEGYVAAVLTEEGTIKANFKVVDTQKLLLEYEDDEDEVEKTLGEVIVDEDVIVIDARGGELKEITFSALRDEVAEDGYVYVIPFANEDATNYSDWSKVEANILVIVD